MTNIRNSVIVFTLISLLFRIEINSQSLKHHQAVAAYLYNFAKNVRWENENRISEFKFHYVGNNERIKEELESLAKLRRLRDKPIKITYNNSELEKVTYKKPSREPSRNLDFPFQEPSGTPGS